MEELYQVNKMNNSKGYNSYEFVKEFMKKYPMTIAWRLKRHCKVIDQFLNPGEKILYAFPLRIK